MRTVCANMVEYVMQKHCFGAVAQNGAGGYPFRGEGGVMRVKLHSLFQNVVSLFRQRVSLFRCFKTTFAETVCFEYCFVKECLFLIIVSSAKAPFLFRFFRTFSAVSSAAACGKRAVLVRCDAVW